MAESSGPNDETDRLPVAILPDSDDSEQRPSRMFQAIHHARKRAAGLRWIIDRIDKARTIGLAAEMAFWVFLSLIPLAAVLGLIVAKIAARNSTLRQVTLSTLPFETRELLEQELARVSAWNGGAVAPFAMLIFFWLASSGVHAVFDGVELQTETPPRVWWRKRVRALLTCVVLSIAMAIVTLFGTGIDRIRNLAQGVVHAAPHGEQAASLLSTLARYGLMLGAATAVVAGLYWIALPKTSRLHAPLLPGALFTVCMHVVVALGYRAFLRKTGSGSAYSAGLSVIGTTLTALYLFCLVLLLGAEFNQILGLMRKGRPWPWEPPGPEHEDESG